MDAVFIEEKNNLLKTEEKIENKILHLNKKMDELNYEISHYQCADYSDVENLASIRRDFRKIDSECDALKNKKSTPYFGRMDFDYGIDEDEAEEQKSETYYIGKESLSIDGKYLVYDWRSQVGQYFYMKSEKEFQINDTKYYLLLRRALEISNGKLDAYSTEYDGEIVTLEGDVIDPFLLTVLKDKRRINRLTDIIKSIQSNQNEIIRLPQKESFIVQGCAGSGKTMILLHRLSYIKFNHRETPFERYKIITPNVEFNAHINELSKELELDSIDRFSVEEYYVHLLKKYNKGFDVNATIESEKSLKKNLLEDLYSVRYQNVTIKHYKEYWVKVLSRLMDTNVFVLGERINKATPQINDYNSASYLTLKSYISDFEDKTRRILEKCVSLQKKISVNKDELDFATKKSEELKEKLLHSKEESIDAIKENIHQIQKSIFQIESYYQDDFQGYNQYKVKFNNIDSQIESINEKNRQYESLYEKEDYYQNIINNNGDNAKELETIFAQQIDEIDNLYKKIDSLPFYSFNLKNKAKDRLNLLLDSFAVRVKEYLVFQLHQNQDKIESLTIEKSAISYSLKIKYEKIQEESATLERLKKENTELSFWLYIFDSISMPNLKDYHREIPGVLKKYDKLYEESQKIKKRIKVQSENHEKNQLELDRIMNSQEYFTTDEQKLIVNAKEIISTLSLKDISKNVMLRDLLALYKEKGVRFRKENYRHKLYIKLLYSMLYFGEISYPDLCISIDEAQDLSISEYQLLRMILGKQCVFNLYGDVNQLVYDYKGIRNWEELSKLISSEVYVLNENYRNTIQITKFCNNEFGAEVFPIGILGENVLEESLEDAIEWAKKQKETSEKYRVAIIFRHGSLSIQKALENCLQKDEVSWFEVKADKISVLSVENAKGLEFDAVVAIVDNMNDNEKYISYTRALNSLMVVREKFNNENNDDNDDVEEKQLEEITEVMVIDEISSITNDNIVDNNNENEVEEKYESVKKDQKNNEIREKTYKVEEAKLSDDEIQLCKEISEGIQKYYDGFELSTEEKKIVVNLVNRKNVDCISSNSWKLLIIFFLISKYFKRKGDGIAIMNADAHLQENILYYADNLNVKIGLINNSFEDYDKDPLKDHYDVVFISNEFYHEKKGQFFDSFHNAVSLWGIFQPAKEMDWKEIEEYLGKLSAPVFLISSYEIEKKGLIDLEKFKLLSRNENQHIGMNKVTFAIQDEKIDWIRDNHDVLWGQGIIYCDSVETCRLISKTLRKKRIKAETFISSDGLENQERNNYLAKSFSNKGIAILVTSQSFGKNLINPNIRFIIHYDIPKNKDIYQIHISQIGSLSEKPVVYDLA